MRPWRQVVASGQASVGYLQGILIENYHYVRAAAIRQSPLLSHAASPAMFNLIRDFVTGEAAHEGYFMEALTRWGVPASNIQQATPLTSTAAFIALQYRLAHQSILDYLPPRVGNAGSRSGRLRAGRRPLPALGSPLRHRPANPGTCTSAHPH